MSDEGANDLVFQQLNDEDYELPPKAEIAGETTANLTSGLNDVDLDNQGSIFSLNFYRSYFNVDTNEVLHRLIMGLNPLDSDFTKEISRPDLYGPIWLTVTGPFLMLVLGNIYALVQGNRHFNFASFVTSLMVTTLFTFGAPFGYRWFTASLSPPPIIMTICLFGYIMVHMIHVSFFCMIMGSNAAFLATILGGALAGVSLFRKLNSAYDELSRGKALVPNIIISVIPGIVFFIAEHVCFQ